VSAWNWVLRANACVCVCTSVRKSSVNSSQNCSCEFHVSCISIFSHFSIKRSKLGSKSFVTVSLDSASKYYITNLNCCSSVNKALAGSSAFNPRHGLRNFWSCCPQIPKIHSKFLWKRQWTSRVNKGWKISLTSWETHSFSRRIFLNGVNWCKLSFIKLSH
jgi:hypothetical protein